jgi:outer membrane protein OmpA-like peptidoglycan-associated protein
MNGKVVLGVLLFLIWGFFSGWYYVCTIKQACDNTNTESVEQSTTNPVSFEVGSSLPIKGESFEAYKLELMNKLGETNLVRISGLYSLDESTDADNLGLERAAAARKLFPELSDDRFVLTSDLIFESNTSTPQLKFDILINNETIENTDFGSVIYYSGIDSIEADSTVNEFARLLAGNDRIKTIDVIGHTDNQLDESTSYAKSMEVANSIKELLIKNGMDETAIFATGKGSSFPLADNLTEEGRQTNNRIEVLINY